MSYLETHCDLFFFVEIGNSYLYCLQLFYTLASLTSCFADVFQE